MRTVRMTMMMEKIIKLLYLLEYYVLGTQMDSLWHALSMRFKIQIQNMYHLHFKMILTVLNVKTM